MLGETGVISTIVGISIGAMWLVTFIWIARSKFVKSLSVLARIVFLSVLLFGLTFVAHGFESWELNQYQTHKALPPLHNRDEFTTNLPFNPDDYQTPIPTSNKMGNSKNYTLVRLSMLGSGKRQSQESDAEFVGRLLQYYIFQSLYWNRGIVGESTVVEEGKLGVNYSSTPGITTPEPVAYSEQYLMKELAHNRFFNAQGWHRLLLSRPFEVPKNTIISLFERKLPAPAVEQVAYVVQLERRDYYHLVSPVGYGVAECAKYPPRNFTTFPSVAPHVGTCAFRVNIEYTIERGREAFVPEDYERWAKELFVTLRDELSN